MKKPIKHQLVVASIVHVTSCLALFYYIDEESRYFVLLQLSVILMFPAFLLQVYFSEIRPLLKKESA